MLYIVYGLDKSGTSMIGSILHNSGINMGNHIVDGCEYRFYEDKWVLDINKSLIWNDSDRYFDVDEIRNRLANTKLSPRIKQYIWSMDKQNKDWGIKDPRLTATFPYWKRHLDDMGINYKIIFVYRTPLANAKRLIKWRKWDKDKALRWWNLHIGHLLKDYKDTDNGKILVEFDYLIETGNIKPLEKFIGKKLINTIKPKERHVVDKNIDYECYYLWNKLKDMDNYE